MSVVIPGATPASADVQMAFAATLVDEWNRCGVSQAVICPGSRSTPLAVALLGHPGIRIHVRLDERSAAFTALGVGLASGVPAVIVTTSGTAAAEVHAAVVEADLARVPLLVCTADRPPELRDIGAPQTIDQQGLFGRAPRWYADPGVADGAGRPTWRSLAARSVAEAVSGPAGPGPVHLNLPFREPLLGDPAREEVQPGRPDSQPWYRMETAPAPRARRRSPESSKPPGPGPGGSLSPVPMLATPGWWPRPEWLWVGRCWPTLDRGYDVRGRARDRARDRDRR